MEQSTRALFFVVADGRLQVQCGQLGGIELGKHALVADHGGADLARRHGHLNEGQDQGQGRLAARGGGAGGARACIK